MAATAMHTIANNIAAVRVKAANTGDNGIAVILVCPVNKIKSNSYFKIAYKSMIY